MKLKKRNMSHFDYVTRIAFGASILVFILAFVFVQPKAKELAQNNHVLTNEIQQLSTRNATLKAEIDELMNPSAVMKQELINGLNKE